MGGSHVRVNWTHVHVITIQGFIRHLGVCGSVVLLKKLLPGQSRYKYNPFLGQMQKRIFIYIQI